LIRSGRCGEDDAVAAWTDEVDEVLGGDLTTAVAYVTPAGGAVATAVAPIGLRDREVGELTFTTSLGFSKKIDRLRKDPKVALAYHAREHGFAEGNERYVLVQGDAHIVEPPDRDYLENVVGPAAERFMGKPKRGAFWDRWLAAYYSDRVPVNVTVKRILVWDRLDCRGEPEVLGEPLPAGHPDAQAEPKKGAGPRVDCDRALRKLEGLDHRLLTWKGADGYPMVIPVEVRSADADGLRLRAPVSLPEGGRRAGLLAHRYNAQLIGLATRLHTGWMTVADDPTAAVYAPHTESGFKAPGNKTLLLLGNGFLARRGLKKAEKERAAAAA
jgi:Pyridoxamine 5'-phosphate oxidase